MCNQIHTKKKESKFSTKAISPVVATALLLVVGVVAVVGFQNWFGTFSSSLFSNTETQSSNSIGNTQIDNLVGNSLYFKNGNTQNITINSVKIDGVDCNYSGNASNGINEINISSCIQNLTTQTPEVVIYTSSGIYSEKFYLKDIIVTTQSLSDCTLNGTTIIDSQSSTFYNTYTSPETTNCSSITRICNNGILSGNSSYNYSSCNYYDPYFSNVVLLIHFNGTNTSTSFNDIKGKVITANGNSQISTNQYKFNLSSAYFNGSSHLSIPSSIDFDFGSSDFTIEFWAYPINFSSDSSFFAKGVVAGSTELWSHINTSGYITNYASTTGAGWNIGSTTSSPLILNSWNHVVCSRNGSVIYTYLNGIQVSNASISGSIPSNVGLFRIASYRDGSSFFYKGYIDEFRVTKGVARYTSNFTVLQREYANN